MRWASEVIAVVDGSGGGGDAIMSGGGGECSNGDGGGENKLANYTVPSYNTSEEDVLIFSVANESSSNQITFGGGPSAYNAATEILFRTASAVDTTVGTEAAREDDLQIGREGREHGCVGVLSRGETCDVSGCFGCASVREVAK